MSGLDLPLLTLALFVAAAAGWFGARLLRYRPHSQSSSVRADYFQGLNFVLNEQPDKALEVFLRMVELDNETVETHFALGSLYRRRGEVDRAIRVHEAIIERPTLQPEHREHATLALAEDYFSAGLFDRAEQLFQVLARSGGRRVPAMRYLLRIYEQQGDWTQAVGTHELLRELASPEHPTAIAHYYCELAEQMHKRGAVAEARAFLHRVREEQRNFPRSALIRADLALDMSDADLALRLCRRVVELHPQLLTVALPRFARAAQARLASGGMDIELALPRSPSPSSRAELAYAALAAGLEKEQFVLECLQDFVREDPTLSDLVAAVAGEKTRLSEEQLRSLATALARIFRRTQRYRCVDCGFASATHFWQCPGCRSWDTLAPVSRLELAPALRTR